MHKTISTKGVINFILVGLFLFFEMGIQVTPNVMAKPLMHDLGLNALSLGFLSSVYFYSYSIMMIPVGMLYDRFAINRLLVIALMILAAGNVLFAVVHPFGLLLLARLLMGFGSAFAFVGVLVIASTWFPSRYFALLVGLTQLMAAFGAMLGETPVAVLVRHIGWRHTSMVFAGAAVVLAGIIALIVRPHKNNTDNAVINWSGVKASLGALLSKKQSYIVAAYAFFSWGPVVLYAELWGASFLQARHPISIEAAASSAMMMWLGIAISAPVLGYLLRWCSHRVLMSVSVFISLLASLVLLYVPGLPFALVLLMSLLLGLGSAAQILSFDLVRANNPGDQFGMAIGFNNVGVVLGGAILQPLAGALLLYHHHAGSAGVYSIHQFNQALWLIPFCFLMAFILSRRLISYRA